MLPHPWQYLRRLQQLWVAMGGLPCTSAYHSRPASLASGAKTAISSKDRVAQSHVAGEMAPQECYHIRDTTCKDYSSCGLQWVAFLPPQHAIQGPQVGPQIWLLIQNGHLKQGPSRTEYDMWQVKWRCKSVAISYHYLRRLQQLCVAMGGLPSTSACHSSPASWASDLASEPKRPSQARTVSCRI